VHTHVRDDAIVLYGFESTLERTTFELLLATPGVGPSTALGALSTMTPAQLAVAVADEDVTRLATIPGIGRKTAARLVLELNGKLPSADSRGVEGPARRDVASDLTAALRQLGYSASEIRDGLRDVELPPDDEAALRVALRQLGRV
jgi:Holliday junction DNA helicase RuvA